jgi:ATP-dependent Clp protease protease subunit
MEKKYCEKSEFEEFQEQIQYKIAKLDFEDEVSRLLLCNRILILNGEINLGMAEDFVRELLYVFFKTKGTMKVILNSVGGEVYAGLFVYNSIKDLVNKGVNIEIEVRGLAASIGCIILLAGSKRVAPKSTRFLIHEIETLDWGKVSELEERAVEVRKLNNMLRDIIAERSGQSKENIDKLWTKKDVWYSAEEAKSFGLLDEVL